MKIEIIKYSKELYDEVINLKLKDEDKDEVIKMSGLSPKKHLIEALDLYSDYILLIIYKNKVEGIFGVFPEDLENNIGVGFFLTSNKIDEFSWDIARYTTEAFEHFLEFYDGFYNYVPVTYKTSIRWLKRNGAIIDKNEYIINNERFVKFTILKKQGV